MFRAVVFDLWQTLAFWPEDESHAHRRRWSESLGITTERLDELWAGDAVYRLRETGPIREALAHLYRAAGVDADVEDVLSWRLELTRKALAPVDGAVETLVELRRRGVATGLISNCTEDVALVWPRSSFAGIFDVTVFSAAAGCMKPDRRIYELALEELRVPASECLFVGDGANNELRGAEEAGLTPVLVRHNGEPPRWDGLHDWGGLRVTSIPEVLELVA